MSKIEVDAITQQSGTTLTTGGGASKTVVVDATTVTLGRCGGTVALASGASQTGFGRTGTVDWQTTPKTGDFTAANGEGYFVNTTSGAINMTMPSGSAGAIVSIQDYNKTFDSNSFTVTPASGEKINGGVADGALVLSTEGQGLTFVYVDATVGWKTVQDNDFATSGANFMIATGGTITTSGNCKIHTFTGPGTFTVTSTAAVAANNVVSHVIVAGGGGGGNQRGGGGGAGGFREVVSPSSPYTGSPLNGYPSAPNRITVTATAFPITVGGGGAAGGSPNLRGSSGVASSFSTITSAGGGGGGSGPTGETGASGGSGGGGGAIENPNPGSGTNGSGNTPPVSPPQGNNGAPSGPGSTSGGETGAGGGGAGAAGTSNPNTSTGGPGGNGVTSSITASPVARAGGGGGGNGASTGCNGGTGGGGRGGGKPGVQPYNSTAAAGTTNTGGGGGGGGDATCSAAAGGSGIVIIRYKFQ